MDPPRDPPAWLQERCRVCGGKLSWYKVSYDCHSTTNKAKLALIGVVTDDDVRGVHPRNFCKGCHNICTRTEKAGSEGRDYTPRLTRFEWGESREITARKVGQGQRLVGHLTSSLS